VGERRKRGRKGRKEEGRIQLSALWTKRGLRALGNPVQ
jgi:hypothetical protein